METATIRAGFASHGVKVRVRRFGYSRFRICTVDGAPHGEASQKACEFLGITDAAGKVGGNINQPHEMFAFEPGYVRRVK